MGGHCSTPARPTSNRKCPPCDHGYPPPYCTPKDPHASSLVQETNEDNTNFSVFNIHTQTVGYSIGTLVCILLSALTLCYIYKRYCRSRGSRSKRAPPPPPIFIPQVPMSPPPTMMISPHHSLHMSPHTAMNMSTHPLQTAFPYPPLQHGGYPTYSTLTTRDMEPNSAFFPTSPMKPPPSSMPQTITSPAVAPSHLGYPGPSTVYDVRTQPYTPSSALAPGAPAQTPGLAPKSASML